MLKQIDLIIKNNELKKESLAVSKINQNLNQELQRTKFCKQESINFLNNTIRDLLNKNKHRNIIINALVENCLDKINELSNTDKSFR